jgi:hypothetical protein
MATAKKTPEPGKAVAERQSTAVAVPDSELENFGGYEVTRDDVAIPFLVILQPLSPQLEVGGPEYLEDAKPGMIMNSVTKELFNSVMVLPIEYKRSFIEWVPRDKGGGFRGEFPPATHEAIFTARLDRATGRASLENGNHLVDTRSFYVLTSSDATEDAAANVAPAMISMASTQIKKAKNWMSMITGYAPPGMKPRVNGYPGWFAVYSLSSVMEQNEKGKWWGWKINRVGFNHVEELRATAAAFYTQVRAGAVRVDRAAMDGEAETTDGM